MPSHAPTRCYLPASVELDAEALAPVLSAGPARVFYDASRDRFVGVYVDQLGDLALVAIRPARQAKLDPLRLIREMHDEYARMQSGEIARDIAAVRAA